MLAILTGSVTQAHLSGSSPLTPFQKEMFRAGHAHAGVIAIRALVAQLLIDELSAFKSLRWPLRIGFPLSGILISFGFFGAAAGSNITSPTPMISMLYVGAIMLAGCLFLLGIGLFKSDG